MAPVRDELRLHGRPLLRLYGYSPKFVATPNDWHSSSVAAGLGADRLTANLSEAGPPPVYIGFGSMPTQDAVVITRIVLAALDRAGVRGVLACGWGGLVTADLAPRVFALAEAPHDRLFPQMAAVVHHGGAGTTAAGLHAGVPAVICPFLAINHFGAGAWRRSEPDRNPSRSDG